MAQNVQRGESCVPQSDSFDTHPPQKTLNQSPTTSDSPPSYYNSLSTGQTLYKSPTSLPLENESEDFEQPLSSTSTPQKEWTSPPSPYSYSATVEQAADLDYQHYIAQRDHRPTSPIASATGHTESTFVTTGPPSESEGTTSRDSTLYLPCYGENRPPKYTRKPTTGDLREPKTLGKLFFILGFRTCSVHVLLNFLP